MSTTNVVNPGDVIAERYRIDRILGKGGMGVVAAATHLELLEPRAIKVMLPHVAEVPEHAKRFLQEARIAARLKSEHAAKVFDMGRLPNGTPYMVMEYLHGEDLASLMKRETTLSLVEAVLYVLQALDALAEAHAIKLVHRDIKHANLFLTRGLGGAPIIKVLDFGISKTDAVDGAITATGEVIGTPLFMAPEQMRGDRDVDGRADIWSLGVLLYWLLTHRYPFEAPTAIALAALIAQSDPPLPPSAHRPGIPKAVDDVVLRCLERDRNRRIATAAELARALAPFVPGSDPLIECIEHRQDGRSSITNETSISVGRMALVSLHAAPPWAPDLAPPNSSPMPVPSPTPLLPGGEKTGGQWQKSTTPGPTGTNRRMAWLIALPFAATVLLGTLVFLFAQSAPKTSVAASSDAIAPQAASTAPAATNTVVPTEPATTTSAMATTAPSARASNTKSRPASVKNKQTTSNNTSDRHTF